MASNLINGIGETVGKLAGSAFDLLDPAKARRLISGLLPGGISSIGKQDTKISYRRASDSTGNGTGIAVEDDWRVRISLADHATIFYKDSNSTNSESNAILGPLIETNGVIFPYTPTIGLSHTANYSAATPTHSNYNQNFYNNSDVTDITISGEFTVQSVEEGKYLMAAIYFFRSATKMFFGQGANAGNPPPIVFLDGYGGHYFPHVPCAITSFSHTLPADVDYIQIPITTTTLTESEIPKNDGNYGSVNDSLGPRIIPDMGRGTNMVKKTTKKYGYASIETTTRLPTNSTISITLKPMYSRKNLAERFNLNDFAQGKLLSDKKNGFGGFL